MKRRPHQPGDEVVEALRQLVRERLARREGGSRYLTHDVNEIILELVVPLRGPVEERHRDGLVAQIDSRLAEALRASASCLPGRAWCHRCGTAECVHAVPGTPRQVFAGYASTGLPRWEDFAQRCLDRQHPHVDELYSGTPPLITFVEDEPALTRHLLPSFRQGEHALLGQVLAGFFPVRARLEEGRGVVAVSIQAVALQAQGRFCRVALNVLGRSPSGEPLEALWDRQDDLPWRRAVAWGQSALNRLSTTPQAPAPRVGAILRGVARRLEHDRRARERRTVHAEERHAGGERPTRSAIEDARRARSEDLLFDDRRATIVILGERGRTHFFTSAGRHVSSVRYRRDAIERKVAHGTWRHASTHERDDFLAKLPRS